MRSFSACLLCLILGAASRASAQAGAAPPGASPPSDVSQPSSPVADAPPLPEVDDPMLAPLPAPPQVLRSWRQALTLVRTRSTTVASARARIAEASARSRQALSSALPEISANGSVRRALLLGTGTNVTATGIAFNTTLWNANLSLRQPLIDVRSWYDISTAETAVEAATMNAADTERLALGALADTIVSVITAERLAEVSRVSLRSNLSTLDLTKRRTALGAASAVDVLRAEQEVASSRSDLVQADESVRQAREALGFALGFAQAWGVTPDIQVDELARDARSVCSPIADPSQRSDVQAARLNVELNERSVSSSGYGYAPTLDLVSDLSYTTQPQAARPVQWSIGAILSVPIYDGGRLASERNANDAIAEVARQQLTETGRRAQLEAVQSQRAVGVAEADFAVSRQARDIAEESARLARLAFVHGTGTSFDLVESARRQRLAEIDATIKEFEVVRARIAALLALSNCDL